GRLADARTAGLCAVRLDLRIALEAALIGATAFAGAAVARRLRRGFRCRRRRRGKGRRRERIPAFALRRVEGIVGVDGRAAAAPERIGQRPALPRVLGGLRGACLRGCCALRGGALRVSDLFLDLFLLLFVLLLLLARRFLLVLSIHLIEEIAERTQGIGRRAQRIGGIVAATAIRSAAPAAGPARAGAGAIVEADVILQHLPIGLRRIARLARDLRLELIDRAQQRAAIVGTR